MATLLDEKKPAVSKLASPNNIYPGNQLQGDSGSSGAPVGATPKPAPVAAPAAARLAGPSELYMQDRAQEMRDQWGSGNYAQAAGTAARTAVQGLGMYGIELADKAATPVVGAAGKFASGLIGSDANAAPAAPGTSSAPTANANSTAALAAAPKVAPAAPMKPGLTNSVGAAPGTAQTAPAASASTGGELPEGVYNHGRGQYSDQASGMGFSAGFTGQPNAQNQRAAASLAAMNSPILAEQQGGVPTFTAPAVAHSGNDWGARQRLKNMETSASSIMNTQRWGGRGAANNPAAQNFLDASRADLAAKGKVPDMQLRTNEVNAGMQRAAMAEAGADRRAQGQIGLGMGQLALGAERNQLDAQRITNDERLRAPQIRAAERIGQLQEQYLKAKTPEEQAALAAQIRAYSGKDSDSWKAVALQGGTDSQGNKTESILGAVNERTGEMRRMGADTQKANGAIKPELADPATRPVGTVSTVGGQQAVWDGKQWVPRA